MTSYGKFALWVSIICLGINGGLATFFFVIGDERRGWMQTFFACICALAVHLRLRAARTQ